MWKNRYDIKFAILITSSVRFDGTNYIHNVTQPSLLSVSKNPFIIPNRNSIPLGNNIPHSSLPLVSGNL